MNCCCCCRSCCCEDDGSILGTLAIGTCARFREELLVVLERFRPLSGVAVGAGGGCLSLLLNISRLILIFIPPAGDGTGWALAAANPDEPLAAELAVALSPSIRPFPILSFKTGLPTEDDDPPSVPSAYSFSFLIPFSLSLSLCLCLCFFFSSFSRSFSLSLFLFFSFFFFFFLPPLVGSTDEDSSAALLSRIPPLPKLLAGTTTS